MKRGIILLLLIASAMAAQVINHDILVSLREDGSAYVQQEYLLRLDDADKAEFQSMIKEGTTLQILESHGVKKAIVYPSGEEDITVEQTQSDFSIVTLQYDVEKIVESAERVGKQELIGITEKAFSFYDGTVISLPYDPPTTLSITVPEPIEIVREPTPPAYSVTTELNEDGAKVTRYVWSYQRPFSSTKFRLLYQHEVPLQSQLSLSSIIQEFRDKYGNPVYIIAGLILTGVAFWYRKEISALLTESFSGEPEIINDSEEDE